MPPVVPYNDVLRPTAACPHILMRHHPRGLRVCHCLAAYHSIPKDNDRPYTDFSSNFSFLVYFGTYSSCRRYDHSPRIFVTDNDRSVYYSWWGWNAYKS